MLAKPNRLTKNKEFERIFAKSYSSFDKLLGIKSAPNDLGINRIGIIISNKVSKKAVERNKIRRRIRGVLENNLKTLKPGYDIVIIVSVMAKEKGFTEIEDSIIFNLKRLRLL